jgi:rRNA maturation endonuclease Nob1
MVWTIKEQEQLANLWVRGFSVGDIAAAIHRPITTIHSKAMRMGLSKRKKCLKDKDDESPKIGRKCLKCRKIFMAEKPQFICKECKSTTEWRSQGSSFA